MADQKIWSNETGQVLLGAGGMVLRQPYNFEKGFYQGANTSIRIVFDGLEGIDPNNHSVMLWANSLAQTANRGFASYPNGTYNNRIWAGSGAASAQFTYEGIASPGYKGFFSATIRHEGICKTNGYVRVFGNKASITETSPIDAVVAIPSIVVGYTGAVNLGYQVVGELRVFKRGLSKEETDFIYANGIGSFPLTNQGLYIYAPIREAEILDFSSAQDGSNLKVGVRDLSGNNKHGYFISLPAGTLSEQRDWANTNLFQLLMQ